VIRQIKIRNTITGNVRTIEVREDHPDDPPAERAHHGSYKPVATGLHGVVLDRFEEVVK
jgi:hypothetical protein